MRIFRKILSYLLAALVLVFLGVMTLLQFPSVQTFLANKAVEAIKDNINGKIEIGGIHLKFVHTLIIKDITIIDTDPYHEEAHDTLFHADAIIADFSLYGLVAQNDSPTVRRLKIRGGGFNLVLDNTREYPNNINKIFRLKPKENPKSFPTKPIVLLENLELENFAFAMQNFNAPKHELNPWNVNWSDVDVKNINLKASDFAIRDAKFLAKVQDFSFKEKSGWNIRHISAKVSVGIGTVQLDNVELLDSFGSALTFDYKMLGRTPAYQDFVNQVCLVGDFRDCRLSLATLARVIPPLNPDSTTFAHLDGRACGTISALSADNLKLTFEDNCIEAVVNGTISGLPNVENMSIDTRISDVKFTTADVTRLLGAIAPRARVDLRSLAPGVLYRAELRTSGVLDDFQTKLHLLQGNGEGQFDADVHLKNILQARTSRLGINAYLESKMFDLKPIFGKEIAQDITMSTSASLELPFGETPLEISADSLKVDNVQFNGHIYNGIKGNLALSGKDISGNISVQDSALVADIDLWSEEQNYVTKTSIKYADLGMMNFLKKGIRKVSAEVFAKMDKNLSPPQGNGSISDIVLVNESGPVYAGDVDFSSYTEDRNYSIYLDSDFAEGFFNGSMDRFSAKLKTEDMQKVLGFILPGLYLEKGTDIVASCDSSGIIRASLNSGRLAYKKNYVKNLSAEIEGPADSLKGIVKATEIAAGGYIFGRDSIVAVLRDRILGVDFSYDSRDFEEGFDGHLCCDVCFHDNKKLGLDIKQSSFRVFGKRWDIAPATASFLGREIEVHGLNIRSTGKSLTVDGAVSAYRKDTLRANAENMNLSVLNNFVKDKNFGFKGVVNGKGVLISPWDETIPKVVMGVTADSLQIRGIDYGTLSAGTFYNKDENRFEMAVNDVIAGNKALNGTITYTPATKGLDIKASLDRFPFGFLNGFIDFVFNDMGGYASGNVHISKKNGLLDLSCPDARIDEGMLEVAPTYVRYYLDGPFHMDNNGIHIDSIKVHDKGVGTGIATGGVKWKRFKDMLMDLHMAVRNIEAIHMPSNIYGSVFYGDVIASGKVDITGPFNNLLLSADAKTTGPSDMHFVISDDMDAAKGELLTFVDPRIKIIDPYDSLIMASEERQKVTSGGFKMRIRAEADQNFKANLDMTGTGFAAGASGTGKGMVEFTYNSANSDFNILGDYALQEGTFDFNASNIVHRQFSIVDGSSIKFGGSIYDTELDVTANYQTKASISALIADTSSVSNRRTILCGIKIKNKLTDPTIKFSIDIPDLDPSVQTAVESALNNEGKVQKQFLSLLISNSFLPDEQSGIVNNSSILYSNVSELMANQINNIFNKLDIPLDMGFNYQPTESGQNLFDVAVSTQLWNNRVIIGGSLGNRQSSSSSSGTIYGDFDIEYKVTRNGAFRVKAFSHAADQYSNYLDQSQRNGLGLTWQQDFDKFSYWIKYLFYNKEKKLKAQEEEMKAKKNTKTLKINE